MIKSKIKVTVILLIAFTIILFSASSSLCNESLSFEIVQYDTLDGHPGWVQVMRINDNLNETDFYFEENGYIRWYAYKMSWQDEFQVLPEETYMVKKQDMQIGDVWSSWSGEPTVSEVVDTATITVSAGTFHTYVVDQYTHSQHHGTTWWAYDVGMVKIERQSGPFNLDWYDVVSTGSFYPLAVGNRWEYFDALSRDSLQMNIDSTAFIFNDTCFVMNMYWGINLSETEYFKVENDTVFFRGYKEVGQPPVEDRYVSTPLYPTVGTEWYSKWSGEPVLFYVEDTRNVTVPAGTFNVYHYSITDSVSGQNIGYWQQAENIGIIAWGIATEHDTTELVLGHYNINGGYGVLPIAIGNQWILVVDGISDIDTHPENLPETYNFLNNYPNPFNAQTTISFNLTDPGPVKLEIYNLLGQKVEILIDEFYRGGPHTVNWDAVSQSSGIYFYKLKSGSEILTRQMTLLK
ncbi:MAG: T9SS type A sorting domain-containing protein [candidate division Zixibacteria bacterium]|nr:T9SS type A sorting domain-containing protein [candidate division Zixibacteria bacterium]